MVLVLADIFSPSLHYTLDWPAKEPSSLLTLTLGVCRLPRSRTSLSLRLTTRGHCATSRCLLVQQLRYSDFTSSSTQTKIIPKYSPPKTAMLVFIECGLIYYPSSSSLVVFFSLTFLSCMKMIMKSCRTHLYYINIILSLYCSAS